MPDGASLESAVAELCDEARCVLLTDAAGIIMKHKRWQERRARRALIGALARQELKAYTARSWHRIQSFGASANSGSFIDHRLWNLRHASHLSLTANLIPTADAMDWETGCMRVWRQTTYGELPNEAKDLTSGLDQYDLIDWEYCCQQITVFSHDLIRIANDAKLARYGNWLDEQRPLRPGPTPRNAWDDTLAAIIADALVNPDSLNSAMRNKTGLRAYITNQFAALDHGGNSPDNRDLERYVDKVFEKITFARENIVP